VDQHEVTTSNSSNSVPAPASDSGSGNNAATVGDERGKEPVLDIIKRAGIDPNGLDPETIDALPTWDEVVRLYGPEPRIQGLDHCQQFQEQTQKTGFVGVAGEQLILKC